MDLVWEGLKESLHLLGGQDPEVGQITLLTLKICGTATLIAVLLGIPLGAWLGLRNFRGRQALLSFVYMGMGLPPVVAGLWVSIFLWRNGPLGPLRLMYTPTAMVIAQAGIALPLVAGLTAAAFQQLKPGLREQLAALGGSSRQVIWQLLREARLGILAAIMAGLGGVISEVGAASMVGGNVRGYTRVLTTAIVLEVSQGHFGKALALGFILLGMAYALFFLLTTFQQRSRQ